MADKNIPGLVVFMVVYVFLRTLNNFSSAFELQRLKSFSDFFLKMRAFEITEAFVFLALLLEVLQTSQYAITLEASIAVLAISSLGARKYFKDNKFLPFISNIACLLASFLMIQFFRKKRLLFFSSDIPRFLFQDSRLKSIAAICVIAMLASVAKQYIKHRSLKPKNALDENLKKKGDSSYYYAHKKGAKENIVYDGTPKKLD